MTCYTTWSDICKQNCSKDVLNAHVLLHEVDDKSEYANYNFVFNMTMF